jgi:hypothetical protein
MRLVDVLPEGFFITDFCLLLFIEQSKRDVPPSSGFCSRNEIGKT